METLLPDYKFETATRPLPEQSVGHSRRLFLSYTSRSADQEDALLVLQGKAYTLDAASDAYFTLAYFLRDLRTKLATAPLLGRGMLFPHHNIPSFSRILAIPETNTIPFTNLMDLPVPFSANDLSQFATCHMRRMMDPTFLQDGAEWGGYYSLPAWDDSSAKVDFDPAMHGVRFTTTEFLHTGSIQLHGTGGMDGVGAFELKGTIDGNTGALHMQKIYVNHGIRWQWVGFLTPFGIVASWGERYGGWVWLYKLAWCSSGA